MKTIKLKSRKIVKNLKIFKFWKDAYPEKQDIINGFEKNNNCYSMMRYLVFEVYEPLMMFLPDNLDEYKTREEARNKNKELVRFLKNYNTFIKMFSKYLNTVFSNFEKWTMDNVILLAPFLKRYNLCLCLRGNDNLEELLFKCMSTEICPVCNRYNFEDDHDICPICGWENDSFYYLGGGANEKDVFESKKIFNQKIEQNPNYRWNRKLEQ